MHLKSLSSLGLAALVTVPGPLLLTGCDKPDSSLDGDASLPEGALTDGGVPEVMAVLEDTKKAFAAVAKKGTETERNIYRVRFEDPLVPSNTAADSFPHSRAEMRVEQHDEAQNGISVTTLVDGEKEIIHEVRLGQLGVEKNHFQLRYGVSTCDLNVSPGEPYIISKDCKATGVSGHINIHVGEKQPDGSDDVVLPPSSTDDGLPAQKLVINFCEYVILDPIMGQTDTFHFVTVFGNDDPRCINTFNEVADDLRETLEGEGLKPWLRSDWIVEKVLEESEDTDVEAH